MAILFYKDWGKYPNAIIDYKTSNRSFLEISEIYKRMGKKNHAFPLALHDKALQGVDPYDYTKLTEELIGRIIQEIKVNPWYFFREIARAPSPAGPVPIRFKANRGNIAIYWNFFNHITPYAVFIRQTGKSFSIGMLIEGLLKFWCANTDINMLTKDDQLRANTVELIKGFMDELPFYLKMSSKTDKRNNQAITVDLMGNKLTTHVAQSSEKAARNTGRGLTTPIIYIDEYAYVKNIAYSSPALLAAGGTELYAVA